MRSEIAATGLPYAFEVVNRLRPRWYTNNSASLRTAQVLVYLDNTRLGGPETLRGIATDGIESMEHLDATQAQNQLGGLGSQIVAGAIMIKSRR